MKTKLTLKRESLIELTMLDLTNVAGGNVITGAGASCPLVRCVLADVVTHTSCDCCTASRSC